MKRVKSVLPTLVVAVVLLTSGGTLAQHKHAQSGQKKTGMKSEMAMMMQSPHHQLMMAYMRTMADFAKTLRDQAVKPPPLDVEFARATVAELRHSLDAMESLHQKHMGMMSAEMQANMKTMMEKMDRDRTMLKDHIGALETAVQADKPDSKQVTVHANALLKQLGMMTTMGSDKPASKKTPMKMKM